MTTTVAYDLWRNEEFRATVKNHARDASLSCPCQYKDFVAHVWFILSLAPPDKTEERYLHLAVKAIIQAKRRYYDDEYLRNYKKR